MTVKELKDLIKNYPDECSVLVDTNHLNGGSFENLVWLDNASPLDCPYAIYFSTNKEH